MGSRWVWATRLALILIMQIASFGITTSPFYIPEIQAQSTKIFPTEDNLIITASFDTVRDRNTTPDPLQQSFPFGHTPCQENHYFLKFDVSGISEFSGKGTLRLNAFHAADDFANYNPNEVAIRAIQVSNAWDDATITSNTQPPELAGKTPVIVPNPVVTVGTIFDVYIPISDITTENGIFSIKLSDTIIGNCSGHITIFTADSSNVENRGFFEFKTSPSDQQTNNDNLVPETSPSDQQTNNDNLVAWATLVIAIGTLVTAFFVWLQIKQSAKSSLGDFVLRFHDDFFFRNPNPQIITIIENGQPLLVANHGPITDEQLDDYLGFFELMSLYERKKILSLEMIKEMFGHYITKARNNAEITTYITGLQGINPDYYRHFYDLAARV